MLRILTGTGDWAISMGELYPNAEVIGTDLSVSHPSLKFKNIMKLQRTSNHTC